STWIPCGHTNMPPPKLLTSFPDGSNRWTGLALVPRQPGAVPGEQRSVAHTERPSRSIATPFDPPHGRFSTVSCPQSRMTRYGLAPLLTGATSCACAAGVATHTAAAAASQPRVKADIDIAPLLCLKIRSCL